MLRQKPESPVWVISRKKKKLKKEFHATTTTLSSDLTGFGVKWKLESASSIENKDVIMVCTMWCSGCSSCEWSSPAPSWASRCLMYSWGHQHQMPRNHNFVYNCCCYTIYITELTLWKQQLHRLHHL